MASKNKAGSSIASNDEKPMARWQHVIPLVGVLVATVSAGVLWINYIETSKKQEKINRTPTAETKFETGCGNPAIAGSQGDINITISGDCSTLSPEKPIK